MPDAPPKLAELFDLTGRTVLVTGASGGIGAGIAARFAEAGANLVIHYRSDRAGAEALARGIGERAIAVGGDVTREADVAELIEAAIQRFGRLDAAINNAADQSRGAFLELTGAQFDATMATNLGGCFRVTKAAALRMRESGGGSIVNISSISGLEPAFNSNYSTSKAGLIMLTRSAALELGPMGVRVNAVAPGLIWREGLERAWPEGVRRYLAHAPLGRLGQAADVADACLYLCSAAARWVTGAVLTVDGGVTTHPSY